jgi:type IV pilus assembly protein PilY1
MIRSEKRISWSIAFAAFLLLAPHSLPAGTMSDYCVQPPFIKEDIKPNLLMVIDNSASMFDLAYVDEGNKGTDGSFTRQPYYCYDQSYKSSEVYHGYFDRATYYSYNFGTDAFEATAGLPASSDCTRHIPNNLCVVHTDTAVSSFVAKGNYLNWLTASKFDIQKEILTGGKYSGGKLIAESRGCVGQSFIKEPITADFVNYASPETNNPNTGLGITFGVRGPYDQVNNSAPSPGGQTYIDIYKGNYNQKECDEAVTAITSGGNGQEPMHRYLRRVRNLLQQSQAGMYHRCELWCR